ncbi:hypothetical protein DL98DRAFT_596763 [Cadophora sp. DSE1049]|nr:hypothetical protein DL98DRAFT_596763 [Cadophora sp. DSE1049]
MASNWSPSTAPSNVLYQEHMAAEPVEADQMYTTPALSQSSSPDMGFDRARASHAWHPQAPKEGNPFLTPFIFYLVENPPLALNPAIFDEPFNGRFLYNVLRCPSTFKRKADRDRHVQSWHNRATLHFCPVYGCEKSSGKPYSRKDKLQEHMRKKHAGLV